ncbi:MAG TPA: hypothetical protein VKH46_00625, partial [Thermoanaerobaculia bacterium]|nr:hypothetical protein [Thermoanaerobaculia bacterium]
MANEVRIQLTDEQKAKIKEGTGKDMGEIRVGSLGNNPAVTAPSPEELSGKSLSGKSLSGKSLSGKSLSGKSLSGKSLSGKS